MSRIEIRNVSGEIVIREARVAADFGARFFGMMFWRQGRDLPALWFPRCNSIHMFFMRIPLDLVFLDAENRVVKRVLAVKPWTPFVGCSNAVSVLEVVPDAWNAGQVRVGEVLVFKNSEDTP